MDEIISKKDAAAQGLRHYFTGVSCKNGHVSPRFVSSSNCSDCMRERNRTPEVKAYMKAFFASEQGKISRVHANRPEARILREERYKSTGKAKEWQDRYYYATGRKKELMRRWARANRHKTSEWQARYNAAKVNATPPWLSKEHKTEMHLIYAQAKQEGKTVDHIVPIRGKNVCGLHVPWNLQLLTTEENSAKGNRFED